MHWFIVWLDSFGVYPVCIGAAFGTLIAILVSCAQIAQMRNVNPERSPTNVHRSMLIILGSFLCFPLFLIFFVSMLFVYVKWWYIRIDPTLGYWGMVGFGMSFAGISFIVQMLSTHNRYRRTYNRLR